MARSSLVAYTSFGILIRLCSGDAENLIRALSEKELRLETMLLGEGVDDEEEDEDEEEDLAGESTESGRSEIPH